MVYVACWDCPSAGQLWDVVWAAWGEAKHCAHGREERVAVTGSRERVWERPLDRGKLGTGRYVLLLMRLFRACAMS